VSEPVLIGGSVGSPYTRKMRSILRYRRIPYRHLDPNGREAQALPKPPLPLQPCVWLPEADGSYTATSDSSFQLRTLEERYPGRSILPGDPALAFLDRLVEDYADEWVTKMMFFYRWGVPENVENAAEMLPCWSIGIPESFVAQFAERFVQRQVDRLSGVVTGSLELCGPLIEASYERLLAILHARLVRRPFLWGARPAASDFALQGQLTQLVQVEPSSQRLARKISKRLVAWVDAADDLSGWSVEGDAGFVARDALEDDDRELFAEIGRTYAPFLVANAAALAAGEERVDCRVDGQPYWQKSFAYQGKCLRWLREAHGALAADDRRFVDGWLAGSGCEALFAD